ncbi:type I-F CRISPR-associated endoribonuclease Cas6/Csy4 [Alcanivorax sp. 1008]|uniref:type I-F CRISPR-associated endoribonuclease Cas6/Csy4 n=1 Tax=Alcanivorax sp. 1008 TaxID=2816853 RepID=UPI001DC94B0C|nr:type I-F CRISPR-associated endoribonuclease Cas6/Csy4 [Alcanivorax sp. 1008]MCC1496770.1 type I-F CRISPR-associated endoribonuclease Cas6/Csy4 [Alcanivorax sp. 1008]
MVNDAQHIDVLIVERSICYEIHERLLYAVHRCRAAGALLAVTWPEYRLAPSSLGMRMRVFGDGDALKAFADATSPLSQAGLVTVGNIEPTPATDARITFYRDRAAEKNDGYLARQNRHEAKNGRSMRKRVTARPAPFYLRMRSQSTRQSYSLFVNVAVDDASLRGGASYGLGYPLPRF